MRIKIVVKFIIFVIIFIIIFMLIGKSFEKYVTSYEIAGQEALYKLPKDSIDVAVFGSSVVQYEILTLEIYNDTKIKILPMAISSEPIGVSYYKMKEMYKYQSPKVIIVDLYLADVDEEPIQTWHFSLDLMKLNFNKVMAVYSLEQDLENSLEFLFPTLAYHTYWKKTSDDVLNYKENRSYLTENSLQFIYKYGDISRDILEGEKEEFMLDVENITIDDYENKVKEYAKKYVDKIVKLAEKEGSIVIFTCMPKINNLWEIKRFEYLRKKYEDNDNVEFLNLAYILKDEINCILHVYDNAHLNYLGAKIVTKYIKEKLENDYEFEHVQEYNDIWSAAYREYIEYLNTLEFGQE